MAEIEKRIYCNKCGKEISTAGVYEDYLVINKEWGYFSQKDTRVDGFIMCEKCYDTLFKSLVIPATISYRNEVI